MTVVKTVNFVLLIASYLIIRVMLIVDTNLNCRRIYTFISILYYVFLNMVKMCALIPQIIFVSYST